MSPIRWGEVSFRRCRECNVVFSSLEGDTRFDRCADCTEIAVLVYEARRDGRPPHWRPLQVPYREFVDTTVKRATMGGWFARQLERRWEDELWRRCR